MTGTCTTGGWIWWFRTYSEHCTSTNTEAKNVKDLFALYLNGTKWEDAV